MITQGLWDLVGPGVVDALDDGGVSGPEQGLVGVGHQVDLPVGDGDVLARGARAAYCATT
jgi:hypothetical protein